MSRRSEWKAVRKAMVGSSTTMGKTVAEKENIPEKACGYCSNFSENAKETDGRGICKILKMGSNIRLTPPLFVQEGEVGYITFLNADGVNCTHFNKMSFIDRDMGETSDPAFRRALRQMDKR